MTPSEPVESFTEWGVRTTIDGHVSVSHPHAVALGGPECGRR